ncbi:hypothetical protein D1007_54076 [Hordeum vulgare]|nr:hypothetical protein D1007_54076 [Hordeum vulgare]
MEEEAPGLSMVKAHAEFVVAQSKEMAKQHAIMDSIWDEAEVEANCRLIWQRQTEADALFYDLDAKIEAEEAASEQPKGAEGAELRQTTIYPPEGMEIVNISDKE